MLSFKEIEISDDERAKAKVYCPNCGHSLLLGKQDKKLCSHCNHYVFKDEITEFHYRLKEKMLKEKRCNNE